MGGLTVDERKQWNDEGYLHLPGVLSAAEVARVRDSIQVFEAGTRRPLAGSTESLGEAGNRRDLCLLQAISFLPQLDILMDHRGVFGKILELMGPYIQLAGSEVLVRYQSEPGTADAHPLHTDGGPALARIFPDPRSLVLTLKAQFFLTNVLTPDSGNMVVVPRSHQLPFPETFEELEKVSGRRIQIYASAGDAVIFPWSLWHGASSNQVSQPRISVVLRYAQLWARPVDYHALDERTLGRMTPRRRRLCGDLGRRPHPGDYYRPPTGEHLPIVLGLEWEDDELGRRYREWETFSSTLYSTEGTHDKAPGRPGAGG